jgi:RimJ/RimL family protein N-acetyltransferase
MDKIFKIEGEKINLRITNENDIKDYERWNTSELKAWQYDGPWYDEDLSGVIEGRKKWCIGERISPYRFLEIETKDSIHIGWVVVYHDKQDPHMTEIGIDIVEDEYWGKGIGEEALSLWIDYLFKERSFIRLGYETWEGNKGMIKLGEKLGFIEEGRIRKGCEIKGTFYDRIKMGILNDEWKKRKQI